MKVRRILTELLEGATLRDRLASGPLSPRKTIDFAVQVAHGLAAAHEKGIVHRDLKPENIFICRDGRTKILDFGLAKLSAPELGDATVTTMALDNQTAVGVAMGTAGLYVTRTGGRESRRALRCIQFWRGALRESLRAARF